MRIQTISPTYLLAINLGRACLPSPPPPQHTNTTCPTASIDFPLPSRPAWLGGEEGHSGVTGGTYRPAWLPWEAVYLLAETVAAPLPPLQSQGGCRKVPVSESLRVRELGSECPYQRLPALWVSHLDVAIPLRVAQVAWASSELALGGPDIPSRIASADRCLAASPCRPAAPC